MIEVRDGNFLTASEDIIGLQVNCVSAMNGVDAMQVKLAYPKVYEAYRTYCEVNDYKFERLLGTMMPIWISGKCIVNLFGQTSYGKGMCFTNYKALHLALKKLAGYSKSINKTVALPWGMGSKDAGGDWRIVYNMIDIVFKDYKVVLYKGGEW